MEKSNLHSKKSKPQIVHNLQNKSCENGNTCDQVSQNLKEVIIDEGGMIGQY